MEYDNLVRMANRIGEFFESMPDAEEATRDIANHIKRFWPPRMRAAILQHAHTEHGAGLKPNVLAAIQRYRSDLEPGT